MKSRQTDRHHCFQASYISNTEGGQIFPCLCNSLMISMKFYQQTQREALLDLEVFYREEHALPYSQSQFYDMWWTRGLDLCHKQRLCWCKKYFTGRSMPFLTTYHRLKTRGGPEALTFATNKGSVGARSILQGGACPSLRPITD